MESKELDRLILIIESILQEVGIPVCKLTARRRVRMVKACMALGNIRKSLDEVDRTGHRYLGTREIIDYENRYLDENISSGSYDDIRRRDLKWVVDAGVVVKSSYHLKQCTNNPKRGYALHPNFINLLLAYDTDNWEAMLMEYRHSLSDWIEKREYSRQIERQRVILPGKEEVFFSLGKHNLLQKLIVEEFLPRFGFQPTVLYVGDAENKYLYMKSEMLRELGVFPIEHEELPDIIAYSDLKNILYIIEAVYSGGVIDELRLGHFQRGLDQCVAQVVYVTCFLNRQAFRKWCAEIAWETEVWIASEPDHLIHFNGHRYLDINE